MDSLLDYRLRTLMVVAETGSLTAAAKQLFVTQPTVSQQLASLAKDLNLPLLVRHGPRVRLTPAAEELVAYANRLMLDNRGMLDRLRSEHTRELHLGVTRSLADFLLPKLLINTPLAENPPKVWIANTNELAAKMLKGELDVALVEGNYPNRDFESIDLGLADFIPISAHKQPPMNLNNLFSHYLLVREPGSGTRAILANWLAAHNASLDDFAHMLELNSPTSIIGILREGVGISFMYRALVQEELDAGELHELDVTGFPLRHPINLIYLKGNSFADHFVPLAEAAKETLERI